jgi:type II secretory pathway component GspD/PulD (secretin)
VPRAPASALAVLIVRIAEQAVNVVPLQHAKADDVVSTLQELLDASRRAVSQRARGCALPLLGQEDAMYSGSLEPKRPESRIVALPQSNSLLLTAPDQTDRIRLRELIARLDQEPRAPRSN